MTKIPNLTIGGLLPTGEQTHYVTPWQFDEIEETCLSREKGSVSEYEFVVEICKVLAIDAKEAIYKRHDIVLQNVPGRRPATWLEHKKLAEEWHQNEQAAEAEFAARVEIADELSDMGYKVKVP